MIERSVRQASPTFSSRSGPGGHPGPLPLLPVPRSCCCRVQVWPDFAVAPALMVAGTDTKHYLGLCQNIFRFMPVVMKASHLNMRALPCKASAL